MPITYLDAEDQDVGSVNLGSLGDLDYLDLSENSLSAVDVDETIIQRALNDMENGYLHVGGSGNANRTLSVDPSLEQLIDDGNEIWLNQSNSDTTILGVDDTSGFQFTNNYVQASMFQCSADCIPNNFGVMPIAPGYFKCAVYTDVSSSPGVLLSANNNSEYVTVQWNNVEMPLFELENGEYYWLLGAGTTNQINGQMESADLIKYRVLSDYPSFEFPSSYIGISWGNYENRNNCFRVRI